MKTAVFVTALAAFAFAQQTHFNSHVLVEMTPQTMPDVMRIQELDKHESLFTDGFDMWRQPQSVDQTGLVRVHRRDVPLLHRILAGSTVQLQVVVQNVQRMIDDNMPKDLLTRRTFKSGGLLGDFDVGKYHSHQEINDYLQSLAAANPQRNSIINIGKSGQGRDMLVLKVGTGKNSKGFMLEVGLHAREWLAHSSAVYMASELATNSQYDDLVSKVDFYILPVANPDGYEYTRSSNRLWRKNRRQNSGGCFGVDQNRNFDFNWDPAIHSSDNPCSEQYRGPSALSEIENQNIANFVRANVSRFNAYITIHTYGQYMAHSWGYAFNTYPPDKQALLDLSKKAVAAIKAVNGHTYTVGSSADIVYPVSGGSDDWAKHQGIQWVYLMELFPNGGFNGFVQPESQIVPIGKETFAAVKVVANKVVSG